MVFTRRSIWELENQQNWHPVSLAYARAVGVLQQRTATDPTSWSYQAAIHGSGSTPAELGWNQCQHGGWFFLPWHRMYLYRMEELLRDAVIADGGLADWALPYWNYDAGGTSNALPRPFRQQTLPDGSPNPLFVAQRRNGFNQGTRALLSAVTSPAIALSMSTFTPVPFPGFGGNTTGFEHFWNEPGGLEQTPHNDVHVALGGLGGWMADPDLAALDPIFWLHHANIDRLWNVWIADPSHANPADAAWLDQTFDLFDGSGSAVSAQVADVLDSVNQLGYQYDDAPIEVEQDGGGPEMPEAAGQPEMIGASEHAVTLRGTPETVEVAIDEQAGVDALAPEAVTPRRLFLSVEHVDAEATPGTVYGVYVEAPGRSARRRVGNVSLFGVHKIREGRGPDDEAHELRLTYDVTDLARELGPEALRGKSLRVTFEPLHDDFPEAEAEAVAAPPIRIGRVSFFTA
jgi:hypothetical protein